MISAGAPPQTPLGELTALDFTGQHLREKERREGGIREKGRSRKKGKEGIGIYF